MKLLLHACCGPCSLEPVRILHEEGHDITIAYFNSNIAPAAEYDHRLATLLEWARSEGIPVVEGPYDAPAWHSAINAAWHEGCAREERCRACYRMRLEAAACWAAEHGFEALGTTLSVSPYQYTNIIDEELTRAATAQKLVPIFRDFREFYPAATTRSRELGMYRQNYCGCAYSNAEAAAEREERKQARKKAKAQRKAEKLAALRTSDFDYDLPEELVAQQPATVRDECRMLVMKRENGALHDEHFYDIYNHLQAGDLLVANETRVMPARLLGAKRGTGGAAEVFLLRERFDVEPKQGANAVWEVLVRPGKRLKPGAVIDFVASTNKNAKITSSLATDSAAPAGTGAVDAATTNTAGQPANSIAASSPANSPEPCVVLSAEIIDWVENGKKGERLARLSTPLASLDEALHAVGHTPLPPYIKNYTGDEELYQTVFAREERSAAAPTAGLHFTPELIERLRKKGVGWETVHLEVGLDTFRVVDEEDPHEHQIHTEYYTVPQRTIDAIERTKAAGGRVVAVGTTSVRSLESAWDVQLGALRAREREQTSLFILPGYEFKVVDALITNFHVPRSTLMMLVSAFSSHDNIMKAYRHAVHRRYRMLSFGDAMFIK